jgi:hypothetical protein
MNLSTKDTQMKSTLGKIIILLLLEILSFAKTDLATYSLTTEKKDVYLKEPLEITFQAIQKEHSNVMFFFLKPKKSDKYKIELLHKTEDELSYHNKRTTFTYLLFPLKSGTIKVDFDFTIKTASDEAVAQVYRGSRDNVKWIETTDTKVEVTPLSLKVKNIDSDTKLVGDFKLISKLKNNHINEYESANITYYLEGVGFDEVDIDPIGKIEDVTIFKDVTKHSNRATKDGYKIKREYTYAILAKSDFFIQGEEIKCYSIKKGSYYILRSQPYEIKVDKNNPTELIDSENYPSQSSYDFAKIEEFFIYIAIFLAGFISAKLFPKTFKSVYKYRKYDDIIKTKTPKELLLLLIDRYNNNYDLKSSISDLENLLYKNSSKKSFNTIKKEILEALK